jgi:hypothetical protein
MRKSYIAENAFIKYYHNKHRNRVKHNLCSSPSPQKLSNLFLQLQKIHLHMFIEDQQVGEEFWGGGGGGGG